MTASSLTTLPPQEFYHGTYVQLSPGDLLTPGHPPNFNTGPLSQVFFTADLDAAVKYARHAAWKHDEAPHVYQVAPQGDYEQAGPDHTSTDPVRIVREVVCDIPDPGPVTPPMPCADLWLRAHRTPELVAWMACRRCPARFAYPTCASCGECPGCGMVNPAPEH